MRIDVQVYASVIIHICHCVSKCLCPCVSLRVCQCELMHISCVSIYNIHLCIYVCMCVHLRTST